MKKRNIIHNNAGITLLELAIVLLVIGILLALAIRGSELIKSAKEKALYNKLRKIETAINIFQDKYDRLPGDWNRNGKVDWYEQWKFWYDLINKTGLLTVADRKDPITGRILVFSNSPRKPYDGIWLEIQGYRIEPRAYICKIDQKYDDGKSWPTGGSRIFTDTWGYWPSADCNSLKGTVEANFNVYRY